jgi:acetyltransferase-like isoleucine patch superfamily enzyme
MNVVTTSALAQELKRLGVETFLPVGSHQFPLDCVFEPPCSVKWMEIHHSLRLGSFSYAVSGHFMAVNIGRYVSIGESVQIGRGDHPTSWLSTSPCFHLPDPIFGVGTGFEGALQFRDFKPDLRNSAPLPYVKPVDIGHDVWIGHAAHVRPGVKICNGAIVAAGAVVTREVPPYAVVAGVPAKVVKYRFPAEIIERLQASQWWRLAPWQLKGVDVSRPEVAIASLEKRVSETAPYQPKKIRLSDLGAA